MSETDDRALTRLLLAAAKNGDRTSLLNAVSQGASLEATDGTSGTALYISAGRGDTEIVQTLVDAGAMVSRRIRGMGGLEMATALNNACQSKAWATINLLLEAGADPRVTSAKHDTPAHVLLGSTKFSVASRQPSVIAQMQEILGRLIKAGNPVDQPNEAGETLLTLALYRDAPLTIIEQLLESGADPNFLRGRGFRPVHQAWNEEKFELLQLLVAYGADLNGRDSTGASALWYADDARTVDLMIELGARPNHVDDIGQSALLSFARDVQQRVSQKDESIMAQMVERGLDLSLADYSGESAVSILEQYNDEGAKRLLALARACQVRTAMKAAFAVGPRTSAAVP